MGSWEHFAREVAAVARVPAGDLDPSARLIEDLGLDSLALTEVAVLMITEFGMASVADDLERRDWSGVTVGELYDEYLAAAQVTVDAD
jgi:acyl carrier protein